MPATILLNLGLCVGACELECSLGWSKAVGVILAHGNACRSVEEKVSKYLLSLGVSLVIVLLPTTDISSRDVYIPAGHPKHIFRA